MFPPLRLREALALGGLSVRALLVRTWLKIGEHEILTRSAAVAFYAMLALVPFLGLVLSLAVQLLPDLTGRSGKVVGIGNMTVGQLQSTLRAMFPPEAYGVVRDQIADMQAESHPGLISVSLAVTIWLASSLFVAIIDAMNRIYGVTDTRPFWKLRLTAIVMTLVQAVILVGSLLTIVAWPQIVTWLGLTAPAALVVTLVQWVIVLVMVLLSFALTFYVGPDAEQKWEWITPGSLAGSVIFLVETFGFRAYVQNFANYNQTYGSLGGVMVLLFWFWLSSVVVLSAGEMNKVIEDASPLGKSFGQKVDPTESPDFRSMKPEPATER
jgi:membrane protein